MVDLWKRPAPARSPAERGHSAVRRRRRPRAPTELDPGYLSQQTLHRLHMAERRESPVRKLTIHGQH